MLIIPLVPAASTGRDLSFSDRVAGQMAIDRVYHHHTVGASGPYDELSGEDVARLRVRTWILQEAALRRFWNVGVSARHLDEEMDRIARDTAIPGRLQEVFGALGHDRLLIREVLVRPLLVDRLLRTAFALDAARHAGPREKAEALAASLREGRTRVSDPHPYRHWVGRDVERRRPPERLDGSLEVGTLTEEVDAFVIPVRSAGSGRPIAFVYRIPKEPFDDWWSGAEEELAESPMPGTIAPQSSSQTATCPPPDVWLNTSQDMAPSGRSSHSAVWTGTHMIVWGGLSNTGGLYDPVTDSWRPTATLGAPVARWGHTAVWTGSRLVIWGGDLRGDGGRYDPVLDSWEPVNLSNAPVGREYHSAIWTGQRMIVWGGRTATAPLDTGGLYDPILNTWLPTAMTNAPSPRQGHTAIWTGQRMVVWGGACYSGPCAGAFYNTGGLYEPASGSWTPTTQSGVIEQRTAHTAVWTGQHMLVWGGSGPFVRFGLGRFDPVQNTWLPLLHLPNEPSPRDNHLAAWTGSRMMVWGGRGGLNRWISGALYDPASQTWAPTSLVNAPSERDDPTMVWADSAVIVWGGSSPAGAALNDGRRYGASPDGDGDGYAAPCDCDDTQPSVYPGAPNLCDGLNNDCDDPAWPDAGDELSDDDGDGYTVCANDCDDGNPTVHPGGEEACDALDNDCDGAVPPDEVDADRDGWLVCAGDCQDGDATVNPGSFEVPGNTFDENCDGLVPCDPTAAWTGKGDYLSCVTRAVHEMVKDGTISREEGNLIIHRATRFTPG